MTYIPEALRRQIAERAYFRCEYCRLHENNSFYTHELDHIHAEKHGGKTIEGNLCFACADCNRHKGSDICSLDPITEDVVALYHPRRDVWDEHFQLTSDGVIQPLTATGRATARILNFNDLELVADRARLIALGEY